MPSEAHGDGGDEFTLRAASREDLASIAEMIWASRRAAGPNMPPIPIARPDFEARINEWDIADARTWVATDPSGAELIGVARLCGKWLEDLYVAPGWMSCGVGSALLGMVKVFCPEGFGLWVFQSNSVARRFYRAHGLVEGEFSDGSENAEREPDLVMSWRGAGGSETPDRAVFTSRGHNHPQHAAGEHESSTR